MKLPLCVPALYRDNAALMRRRRQPGWPRVPSAGPSGAVGTGTITISSPVQYRVFQRGAGGQGTISISGTYTGDPGAMEASFNGGGWQRISDPPTSGVWSGQLANQDAGQGTLSVRWIGNAGSVVSVNLIGIGDIFVIAGQSNACGMAESNQSYSNATLKACLFGNDYAWKELVDPVDSNSGQVDAVSADAGTGGSCWPRLATRYLASQGVPCAFIPCAKVGTQITTDWAIPTNHQDRTTLYGSMVYRALQVGSVKCVLWWQGESDAVNGTAEATYNAALDTLANAVASDLGVKLLPCKLEMMNDAPWNFPANRDIINAAINTAWGDNANIAPGPDLSGYDFGGIHFSAAQASTIGDEWWTAVRTAFGWSA